MTQNEWRKIFAKNLITILEERNISQRQLSKDSGISLGMISNYINGISMPGATAVVNLSYALDIDTDELIDFGDRVTIQ